MPGDLSVTGWRAAVRLSIERVLLGKTATGGARHLEAESVWQLVTSYQKPRQYISTDVLCLYLAYAENTN